MNYPSYKGYVQLLMGLTPTIIMIIRGIDCKSLAQTHDDWLTDYIFEVLMEEIPHSNEESLELVKKAF